MQLDARKANGGAAVRQVDRDCDGIGRRILNGNAPGRNKLPEQAQIGHYDTPEISCINSNGILHIIRLKQHR